MEKLLNMVELKKIKLTLIKVEFYQILDPEFIKNCENGVCTFMKKPKANETDETEKIAEEATVGDSKKEN